MKITLDTETIRTISLFQKLTGTHVLDSYDGDEIYFIVAENEYGFAVGKNGIKIKKAESVFKKPIKVFEYSPDLERFIRNMVPQTKEISNIEGKIELKVSPSDRSRVIGKAGYRVKIIENFLKRSHDVISFKVK